MPTARGLPAGACQEVVEVVLRHRFDILFLGGLVTPRSSIGRLTKRVEAALHDEWFVTTNITALPGRPVGIGAVIHCSLANSMTDYVDHFPDAGNLEPSKQEGSTA